MNPTARRRPPDGPRVVVTGGAGYVGSVLVPHLLALGYRVHVVDSLRFGGEGLLPNVLDPAFSFEELDVLDHARLRRALRGADVVVHLAAIVGYPACNRQPEEARRVNVDGTHSVLDALPPDARLVYASTGSNYGAVAGVCDEDTPLQPLSLYGETKTLAEAACLSRPNSVAPRFATAFGLSPRLRLDLLVNDFAYQALTQRTLLVYERHFRRTFLHVRDMARAIAHLLDHWDGARDRALNVGHERMNLTKEEVARRLRERVEFHLCFADVGTDEDRRDYEVGYARMCALGFDVSIDMDRGLDELVRGLPMVRNRNPYTNA